MDFIPISDNIDKYSTLWKSYPSKDAVLIEMYEKVDKTEEGWKFDVFDYRYYIHSLVKFRTFPFSDPSIHEEILKPIDFLSASQTYSPFFSSYPEVIEYTLSMISDETKRLESNVTLYKMIYELVKTQRSFTGLQLEKCFRQEAINNSKLSYQLQKHDEAKYKLYREQHKDDNKDSNRDDNK